ncbi:MAG: hypothetical protein NT077_00795 [Candidatus Taylorbacteria bacterium]|nr:hypothetical protein [Candidatus Taylorbacteria bacterium]
MPRRVEDIIRSDRRSIRSIPVEKTAERPRRSSVSRSEAEETPIPKIRVTPPQHVAHREHGDGGPTHHHRKSRFSNSRRLWLGIIIAVVVIVAGTAYIASNYFSRATFTIVPVTVPISVSNMTIVATGTSTAGYLKYDIVKYSGVASTTLPATDGPSISTKSSGTVVLYNAYSAQGQRLIAGTRFVSDSGFVYRLAGSVFIPAYTSSNGTTVPGTIRAVVSADNPGVQYNLSKGDGQAMLHIIAYKDTPRYDTVYAKLYTDIAGGFAGTKKTVNQTLLASTTKNLEAALMKSLQSQAMTGVPAGYVTYANAFTTSFAAPVVGGGISNTANISVSGTLYNVIFKKSDLITKLAGSQNIDRFGKAAFSSSGLESLKFTITNPGTFKPAKATTLIARLNGNMVLKGTIPTSELKHKLAGLSLAGTRPVFATYSSVIDTNKSFGELFPSWASAVPKDENRISLIIKE